MSMTSNRRAEASRINGAKSRGPITPDGKARSSQNSITHGLTARNPCLATENRQEYEQLRQTHIDHFTPSTPYELDIVDQLTAIAWRTRRAESIETALLDQEIDIRKPDIEKAFQTIDAPGLWAIGFKSLSGHCNASQTLDRHQARLDRQYKRLIGLYEKIKSSNEPGAPTLPREAA